MKANQPTMNVSTRSVWPVIGRLRVLALDSEAVIAAAGCDAAALRDPDGRIPHERALALWREAGKRSRDDAFGIHAAEQIRPGAFDVLDYATRSSATLGEGLQRLVRYHRILHDAAVVQLDIEGPQAVIRHVLPDDAAELPRQTAEFIVAAWLVVARQATGIDFEPLAVRFRHPPPADLAEHESLFRAPIEFNASANELVLPRPLLDVALTKSDPGLCAVLERHMRELLDRMPRASSFTLRVRQVIARNLSDAPPNVTAVARALHMSRRTLQRQLQAEGTSFVDVVDSLRHDLALRYLREPEIAIAEVAFLLGFSEASAFHRAFKRWLGITPAAFRAGAELPPVAPKPRSSAASAGTR